MLAFQAPPLAWGLVASLGFVAVLGPSLRPLQVVAITVLLRRFILQTLTRPARICPVRVNRVPVPHATRQPKSASGRCRLIRWVGSEDLLR